MEPLALNGHGLGAWRRYRIVSAVTLICIALAVGDDPARVALRYGREEILQGQWWRVLSGHVVHLGWNHTLMNMAAWILIWFIFRDAISDRAWSTAILWCSLGVSAGLFFLNPDLRWYVGFSGTLHGLFVLGALMHVQAGFVLERWLLVLLAAKLAWEHWYGAMPGSEQFAGGNVIVDAHLYGAVAGLVIGLFHIKWRGGAKN